MPPQDISGGVWGATPPQVSFERLVERPKGDGENWLGGGPPRSVPGGTFQGPGGEGKGGAELHSLTPF